MGSAAPYLHVWYLVVVHHFYRATRMYSADYAVAICKRHNNNTQHPSLLLTGPTLSHLSRISLLAAAAAMNYIRSQNVVRQQHRHMTTLQ